MTKDEAREILDRFNKWRRGVEDVYEMLNGFLAPNRVGQAIDCAIQALGDGWVSVEDDMEILAREVLATDGRNYLVGYLGRYGGGGIYCESGETLISNVSHYQILSPPNPKP